MHYWVRHGKPLGRHHFINCVQLLCGVALPFTQWIVQQICLIVLDLSVGETTFPSELFHFVELCLLFLPPFSCRPLILDLLELTSQLLHIKVHLFFFWKLSLWKITIFLQFLLHVSLLFWNVQL